MMKYLSILNDTVRIPLAILTGFSYPKRANVIETQKNTFVCRGLSCSEVNVAFTLTPPVVSLFNEASNEAMTFQDLVMLFMTLEPDVEVKPSSIILADNVICPELLFSLTSITATPSADLNGVIQQVDVNLVLSGSACSKVSSKTPNVSYDENLAIPETSITVNGQTALCQDDIAISEMVITPTTLNITLLLSTSHKMKSSNAWIFTPTVDKSSYFTVNGYGNFYIVNASTNEDSCSYECSIFDREADVTKTFTVMDGTITSVLRKLELDYVIRSKALADIRIDNYFAMKSSPDCLKELQDSLGFLTAWHEGKANLFELPESLNNPTELAYYIQEDEVSSPTTAVVFRDGLHEYKAESGEDGFTMVVYSPVCTPNDRSSQILRIQNFMEHGITLTTPLIPRIRHYSGIRLVYNGTFIDCLVTDYSIDVLQNTMTLRLNYIRRG